MDTFAFPVAASRAWNGLPSSVTAASSLSTFHQELEDLSLPVEFSVTYLSRSLINFSNCIQHVCCILIDTVKCSCNVLFVTAYL